MAVTRCIDGRSVSRSQGYYFGKEIGGGNCLVLHSGDFVHLWGYGKTELQSEPVGDIQPGGDVTHSITVKKKIEFLI